MKGKILPDWGKTKKEKKKRGRQKVKVNTKSGGIGILKHRDKCQKVLSRG